MHDPKLRILPSAVVAGEAAPNGTDRYIYQNFIPEFFEFRCIFDVGANFGQTAIKFGTGFPESTIFSFEPVESNYKRCVTAVEKAKMANVKCFHLACGSQAETVRLYHQNAPALNTLVSERNTPSADIPGTFEVVEVKTIDQISTEHQIERIDILKTDTEGFDLNVLKGAGTLLRENRVGFVMCEVNFRKNDTRNTYFHDAQNYLESFDFEFIGFYDLAYHARVARLVYCNAIFYSKKGLGYST